MSKKSLGLVETIGLAAAIEAADTAVKSANVTLVGYELTRGDGMVTVKVEGEVGAVNAAVAAAAAAAKKINRVVSTRVIARPADSIAPLVANKNTVGVQPPEPESPPPPTEPPIPPEPPAPQPLPAVEPEPQPSEKPESLEEETAPPQETPQPPKPTRGRHSGSKKGKAPVKTDESNQT